MDESATQGGDWYSPNQPPWLWLPLDQAVYVAYNLGMTTISLTEQSPRSERKNGAGDGIRTHDNDVGNVVLYQLSYTRP